MIYTAVAKIDVNANQPYDTEPEYDWIDIDQLTDATHVCAVRLLHNDLEVADIHYPTAAELAFIRDVIVMSEIRQAARDWRADSVYHHIGVRASWTRLMTLLGLGDRQ